VTDAEQVGGGVEVEAGVDGQPMGAGADAGAAPAGAVVEGGEAECELGLGGLDVSGELTELAAEVDRGVLVELTHDRLFHTANPTEYMFVSASH